MLILSRRAGDAVLIDGGIRIQVVGVVGGSVRLGIEAPTS
ncbi:MAG: carbon storage regulator, partial [Longimicrobiales bacterium]